MRRLQFSLRTLLVAMLVLGALPWLAIKWREREIWSAHRAAKMERDQALVDWRNLYDQFVNNQASAAAEAQARKRYFAARQGVETTAKTIQSFYGESQDQLQRGLMAHGPPANR
jgi:cell division protein FtsL